MDLASETVHARMTHRCGWHQLQSRPTHRAAVTLFSWVDLDLCFKDSPMGATACSRPGNANFNSFFRRTEKPIMNPGTRSMAEKTLLSVFVSAAP